MMITVETSRPRDVNAWRAAAILYGDWGTSKAYVIGLAFALAAYSSFWFILAVSILTLLVAINYITICRLYPHGGGVYASVRNRSEALSLLGAFFLISDYLVTAALSALSAFHYLGVPQPEFWAIGAIAVIGGLNYFGPRHTGSLAIALAIPAIIVVICLALTSIPFIPQAVADLTPISRHWWTDWNVFVGVIVALSGIEAIANTTGSMKLDPGSTYAHPKVGKTSTRAILMVMVEVCLFTAFFGLAMNALPGLEINNGDVNAPDFPNVRDAMLRYMAQVFSGELFGPTFGYYFGLVVSVVFALLLLSAVNTAMVALISLSYILANDGELPSVFKKLNSFGVPVYGVILTLVVPILILLVVHDISGLANLYAIGFVGAIAVNLGATSTNFKLDIKPIARYFMFATFLIMTFIEITLFIDKPEARGFVITIMAFGLFLRMLVVEQKQKVLAKQAEREPLPELPKTSKGGILAVVTGIGRTLDFALKESQVHQVPLHILFVREQRVKDDAQEPSWLDDTQACEVFDYVAESSYKKPLGFLYTVTAHPAHSIAEIAKDKNVDEVIIGRQRGIDFINMIRGTTIGDLSRLLPNDVSLIGIY